MRTSPCDDPRLTAYALGELDDLEAVEVARWLETTPDARQALAEIRQTIDRVSTALSAEASGAAALALSDEQRAALHRAVGNPRTLGRQSAGAGITPASGASRALSVFWLSTKALAAAVLMLALTAPGPEKPQPVEGRLVQADGADRGRTHSLILGEGLRVSAARGQVETMARALDNAGGSKVALDVPAESGSPRSLYLLHMAASQEAGSYTMPGHSLAFRVSELRTRPEQHLRVELQPLHLGLDALAVVGQPAVGDVPYLVAGRQLHLGYPLDHIESLTAGVLLDVDGDGLVDAQPMHFLVDGLDLAYNPPTPEQYGPVVHNPFLLVERNPLSTFSVDVDTASYANVRRYIRAGLLPPPAAVRTEELINYFSYDYAPPPAAPVAAAVTEGGSNAEAAPIALHVEMSECPWAPAHRLMRVALKAREVDLSDRPPANIVLLIDVSGSMDEPDRLPLIKEALSLLVDRLGPRDSLSIVSYAAEAHVVLPATRGDAQHALLAAIDSLVADGSTNGGAGLELAYQIATENRIAGGENRVILATDGDFNVGVTDDDPLAQLVREKAAGGVFLTVLGVGRGNFRDEKLELLANRGNGHYLYLDTLDEAFRALYEQAGALFTVARDVKIQVEFNPAVAQAYRLIGYENRLLAASDFNDDANDAGEINGGHAVTALYEIVPIGAAAPQWTEEAAQLAESAGDEAAAQRAEGALRPDPRALAHQDVLRALLLDPRVDPLEYHSAMKLVLAAAAAEQETATIKLRYKTPDASDSALMVRAVVDAGAPLPEASDDFRFAAAVASFSMVLRGTPELAGWTLADAFALAQGAIGPDEDGARREFLALVAEAQRLSAQAGSERIQGRTPSRPTWRR